ncbi:MAG: class I SAM-dependent methyltransferase [Marinoscillum sp.]
MKRRIYRLMSYILEIGFPITLLSAIWMKLIAVTNTSRVGKLSDYIFMKIGVLPVNDHYYQPLINPRKHLSKPLAEDRPLPGLAMNTEKQLEILSQFTFQEELLKFPLESRNQLEFFYNNGLYESGDAEFLYSMIRLKQPKKIIEVGCGFSSLMIANAVAKNKSEDNTYVCSHECIEPYEMKWLSKLNVQLIKNRVQDTPLSHFKALSKDDILFIDSSHIIRPQGDVLFEIQEILPILQTGVIIHFHDIFTPRDYPETWISKEHRLWNEQYLLEAFLSHNSEFEIIGALNYLTHKHFDQLSQKCPVFASQSGLEPGALWIQKK